MQEQRQIALQHLFQDDDDRSANFGRMAVASNLGFVFGPALAGLLGAAGMGEIVTVVAALLISVVACLLVGFGLPDSMPCVLGADPEQVRWRPMCLASRIWIPSSTIFCSNDS